MTTETGGQVENMGVCAPTSVPCKCGKVERASLVHTEGVTGSIPVAPTIYFQTDIDPETRPCLPGSAAVDLRLHDRMADPSPVSPGAGRAGR